MAVEIRHSRTATLVDSGANPGYDANEIQAADWNDTHPVTADGMGLLFANSAGAVAETMTVDMGTLTASTPLTFRQTWDNAAQDVTFSGFEFVIDDGLGTNGSLSSRPFSVKQTDGVTTKARFTVDQSRVGIGGNLSIYTESDVDSGVQAIFFNGTNRSFTLGSEEVDNNYSTFSRSSASFSYTDVVGDPPIDEASYGPTGITRSVASADFTLPVSETALAQWANVPTNTDIADGYSQVGVDTNTGDVYLAANVGGTIFKVQLV